MKSGICPKCGSGDIYVSYPLKNVDDASRGRVIYVRGGFPRKFAGLIHYACASCNYIESYVANDGLMKNIIEAWQPLNKEKRKRKNDEA